MEPRKGPPLGDIGIIFREHGSISKKKTKTYFVDTLRIASMF